MKVHKTGFPGGESLWKTNDMVACFVGSREQRVWPGVRGGSQGGGEPGGGGTQSNLYDHGLGLGVAVGRGGHSLQSLQA